MNMGWIINGKIALFSILLILIACPSDAQQYPTKPINLLVGYAPGGNVDISTRILVSKAEKFLGQPFVISNNGGGGGSVALGITAKERPDGYHLANVTTATFALIPQLRTVPFKLEDFAFVMAFGAQHTGLVVRADSPWKTLKELVEYAKQNPGKVTYSTAGVGLGSHLAMEYIAKQEGIKWTHIPYPGGAPALTALLGGHVSAESGDPSWVPHIKEGTIRLLAVHEEKRMNSFPNVPTLSELGYNFKNENMFILAAPKGTPSPLINKLGEAFHKAMEAPEFIQVMLTRDNEIAYRNSTETKSALEEAYNRFAKMIAEFNIPKEGEGK